VKNTSWTFTLSAFLSTWAVFICVCRADPPTLDPNQTVQQAIPVSGSTQCPPVLVDPLKKALCDEDRKAICSMEKLSDKPTASQIREQTLAKNPNID
jgi:hypothetical protein